MRANHDARNAYAGMIADGKRQPYAAPVGANDDMGWKILV